MLEDQSSLLGRAAAILSRPLLASMWEVDGTEDL